MDSVINRVCAVMLFCLAIPSPLLGQDIPKSSDNNEPGPRHFARGFYGITKNVTFTDNVVLEDGAVFTISDGVVVTFKGTFSAPVAHVFRGNGKVVGLKKMMPEWFGAVGNGIADDTAAIQRTLDSCELNGTAAGTASVVLLTKSYLVGSLTVRACHLNIHAENAWLIAKPTGHHPYLLRYEPSASFCTITGTLNIDGKYSLEYDCIVNVNARYFISHNVVIWRASLAWLFGDRKWATSGIPGDAERGDSEIEIIGGSTANCLRGVEAVGANTIIHFSNALIYCFPWSLPAGDPKKAAWEKADSTLVRCIGSLVYFTGGGLCNFSPTVPLIEVQPIRCTQPEYYSNYGGVYVSNVHIESGYLFATANPNRIQTQDHKGGKTIQRMASLNMHSCGGYVCGNNIPIHADPLFTGRIILKECNFYGINRTANLAKIGNPLASVDIDDISFNDDHPKGPKAVIRDGTIQPAGQ